MPLPEFKWCVVTTYYGINFISLMTSDIENIFMYLFPSVPLHSSVEYLFKYFAQLFIGLFFFYY